MNTIYHTTMKTPIGEIRLLSDGKALTGLYMGSYGPKPVKSWQRGGAFIERAEKQLRDYFAGTRKSFDLPLAGAGTEFQKTVWKALCDIPYGETISYGELARRIGLPMAARAVGAANGSNPISIVVPCHRVIGANGTLTGYGGGLPRKKWLLEHETGVRQLL